MADLSTKFQSSKQDWTTPHDLFGKFDEEFKFTLDAAASAENALTPAFIDQAADAMSVDWGVGQTIWLNPPFGDRGRYSLKSWIERALAQSRRGNTVVLLIPARTNTEWFHDICLAKGEVRFVRGRPKFGGATHGLPQPLCIVVFRCPND